ncbi:MAG TPA: GAF and ANTAR domain-containing protein [Mycobacterium sp.]|nr:GAF and ANTAR domain-containing protein [Mycobacterium sp.]
MAELARHLAVPLGLDDVLDRVTKTVLELIPGADAAGFLLFTSAGKFETMAATSELMYEIDRLQIEHGQGPCIEAAVDELIVRTNDFQREQRWPQYSADVLKLGMRSALSFKLYTSQRNAGALNIFGFQPDAFGPEDEGVGSVLAAHAAAAVVASRHGDQLQSALSSRDQIGQAKGIIMERFQVDAVRAFELLRELSQTENVKLVEIAQRVIDTRGT